MSRIQPGTDWRQRIESIADGWLFSDVTIPIPSSVIIPFENPDYFNWADHLGHLDDVRIFKGIAIGRYGDRSIGVLKSKFGSAAVCFAVHLLARRGVQRVVGVGYCGGIHPSLRSGHVVVPTSVSRIACTSRRYLPVQSDIEASPELLAGAKALPVVAHAPLFFGRTVSTDDILLENSTQMETFLASDLSAIDMECGALYAMGRFFDLQVLTFMVVSDLPLRGEAADYSKVDDGMKEATRAAFSVLAE